MQSDYENAKKLCRMSKSPFLGQLALVLPGLAHLNDYFRNNRIIDAESVCKDALLDE